LIRRNQTEFSEPVALYCEHALDPDVYQILKNRPLPLRPPVQEPDAPKSWRHAAKDQSFRDREEALAAMLDRLDGLLGGA